MVKAARQGNNIVINAFIFKYQRINMKEKDN